MFIRDVVESDYQDIRNLCLQMVEDKNFSGFQKVNFINYSIYLDKLKLEFPQFSIEQKDFGITVNKKGG